jgi:arylsulfatase
MFDHAFVIYPMPDIVGEFLATFEKYPPRQRPGSFSIGNALEMLQGPIIK